MERSLEKNEEFQIIIVTIYLWDTSLSEIKQKEKLKAMSGPGT